MARRKETRGKKYDYIDWWLYEGGPDYEVWSMDEKQKWVLKEPLFYLYAFINIIRP